MGRISPSKQNMAGKTVNMNGGNASLDVNLYDQFKDQVAKTSGQIADAVMPPLAAAIEKVDDVRQNIVKTADAITPWDDNKLTEDFNKSFDTVTQGLVSDYDDAETRIHSTVSGGVTRLTGLDSRIAALVPLVGLTIKDPKLIAKGIKQGSARSPQWAKQTREFDMRVASANEKYQTAQLGRSKSAKSSTKEAMYNDVSTGPTRDPIENLHTYGDTDYKVQSEINPLTEKGNIKYKQQHHLFSKQESYQFVKRMQELGDDDDVLNMFLYAEDLDATMGGRLKNMLDMEDKPHNLLHASRKRKVDGRELQAAEMRNLVENAKSTTELMKIFNKYIMDNVLPSIDEAKAFKVIGERLLKEKKYGFLDELYDKHLLRKPRETV